MIKNRIELTLSQELLDRANDDDNFLKSIITGDEKWVYGYEGVVHYEFLPQGRTANKEYYLEVR